MYSFIKSENTSSFFLIDIESFGVIDFFETNSRSIECVK